MNPSEKSVYNAYNALDITDKRKLLKITYYLLRISNHGFFNNNNYLGDNLNIPQYFNPAGYNDEHITEIGFVQDLAHKYDNITKFNIIKNILHSTIIINPSKLNDYTNVRKLLNLIILTNLIKQKLISFLERLTKMNYSDKINKLIKLFNYLYNNLTAETKEYIINNTSGWSSYLQQLLLGNSLGFQTNLTEDNIRQSINDITQSYDNFDIFGLYNEIEKHSQINLYINNIYDVFSNII